MISVMITFLLVLACVMALGFIFQVMVSFLGTVLVTFIHIIRLLWLALFLPFRALYRVLRSRSRHSTASKPS